MSEPTPRRKQPQRQEGIGAGPYTQVTARLNAAERDIADLLDLLTAGLARDGEEARLDAVAAQPDEGKGERPAEPR